MSKIITWIKNNILVSVTFLVILIFLLFPRSVKKALGMGTHRVKHRPGWEYAKSNPRAKTKSGKQMPRSVGTRSSSRGYPKVGGGYIPFKRNKNGSIKKAKFVAGTIAAKNYMAQLRRKR